MGILQTLGTGQGYLKAGVLGFQSSGKTLTATLLAVGARKHFGLEGPIAMADTEAGSEYIAPKVAALTGLPLLGVRTRCFSDLMDVGQECLKANVSVLLVDSLTHYWQEVVESYLKQINQRLASRSLPRRTRLEFQDMAPVKAIWAGWTDFYLNSKLHIIVCGRAGFIWDFEKDEETGKKDLIKTGIKMKGESEMGYEPSLLWEMERQQIANVHGGFRMSRQAIVLKDRFGVIDGHVGTFDQRDTDAALRQTFDFFRPHLDLLTPGAHSPVNTEKQTNMGMDDSGDDQWAKERKTRVILCEEIQGEIVAVFPGQSAAEKKMKADILQEIFHTRSWTAVEGMDSVRLREGLEKIREKTRKAQPAAVAPREAGQEG